MSEGNPWCNTLWSDKGDRTWGEGAASWELSQPQMSSLFHKNVGGGRGMGN